MSSHTSSTKGIADHLFRWFPLYFVSITSGVILTWALIAGYYDDLNQKIEPMVIVGKTIVDSGRAEREACIVESNTHSRIIVDDNGCMYQIDERVMVKFHGSSITIVGLA